MKLRVQFMMILGLLSLVACNETAVPTATTTAATSPPPLTEPTPGSALATVPPVETPTDASSDEITMTATVPGETAVLSPTLFDISWDDRTPFQAGLIDSEQGILAQLPGATVYHLDVQLAAHLHTVTGRQEIQYTNRTGTELYEIYFHLFPNLLDGDLEVTRLVVNGQNTTPTYEPPRRSIMRVPLVPALPAGESVIIQIDFVTEVPQESGRNYGVFAYVDDILALAHFYPQVAVYDDEGWNIAPPAEGGDVTYAESSFYLVRVTAATAPLIAASGIAISREETADGQTITFAAGPMRDFYLAASERYQVTSHTLGQTTINSYAPADMAVGAETALGYGVSALQTFSDRFSPYPFTELDIVSTPTLALGIEYPGIIANRLALYDLDASTPGTPNNILLESTTAHEIGHQWFYSLVGNDQLDDPWLDESLTQYATWLYYLDLYGENGAQGFYQSLDGRWGQVDRTPIPIGQPVAAYNGAEYSSIIYGRGPIFFDTLAQTMGQDTFDTFLRDYVNRNKWGIAVPEQLKELAEFHCQCDLTSLFEAWVYDN